MTGQPPYVLGLDTALRRTGVAAITNIDGACTEAPSYGSVHGSPHERAALLDRIGYPPALALIELGGGGVDRADVRSHGAGLWWSAAGLLVELGVPVGTCAPATRAKWATGNGKADKAAVVAAMRQLWPGLPCTQSAARHNECDGLALAHACAQRLGWPVPVRRHHGESLAVIRWPETVNTKGI